MTRKCAGFQRLGSYKSNLKKITLNDTYLVNAAMLTLSIHSTHVRALG